MESCRMELKIICPKCKEEIETLQNVVSGSYRYDLYIDDGSENYEGKDFVEDNNVNEFWCPECKEVLFTDEDKAIKFLKGK